MNQLLPVWFTTRLSKINHNKRLKKKHSASKQLKDKSGCQTQRSSENESPKFQLVPHFLKVAGEFFSRADKLFPCDKNKMRCAPWRPRQSSCYHHINPEIQRDLIWWWWWWGGSWFTGSLGPFPPTGWGTEPLAERKAISALPNFSPGWRSTAHQIHSAPAPGAAQPLSVHCL